VVGVGDDVEWGSPQGAAGGLAVAAEHGQGGLAPTWSPASLLARREVPDDVFVEQVD
jgi:hypothetical protein